MTDQIKTRNIKEISNANNDTHKILYTDEKQQLVVMCVDKGGTVPKETHGKTTQFIRVESGTCKITVGETSHDLCEDDFIIIPYNTVHEIINTCEGKLKLSTIYSPPETKPEQEGGYKKYHELYKKNRDVYNKIKHA